MLYRFIRPIIKVLFLFLFTPRIIGRDKIPEDGRIVLAGNHTSVFDCLLLMSSTSRSIHFLAKKELFSGVFGFVFSNLGLIPVDRSSKSPLSLVMANDYLSRDEVVCVFPEGTIGRNGLLPFKYGAVKMASDSGSKIVPFVITGKYRLFSRSLCITFLDGVSISDDLVFENNRLRDLIVSNLEVE